MADLKDLIEQLQSEDWEERRDAAQGLAKVAPQERDQALRALQDRLAVEDDGDVIKAIVEALVQLGAPESEVYDLLVRRTSENYWPVRRGMVRGLAKLQDPAVRPRAIEALKERLAVEGGDDVIEAIVEALVQLGAPESEVYDLLVRRTSENYWRVRRGTVRGLAKLQDPAVRPRAIEALKERLAVEDDHNIIKAIVEALHARGVKVEEMSRTFARNPHLPQWIHDLWWHREGVVGQVLDHALHRRWWRIPPDVRRHFALPWRHHEALRCPECHMMWHELVHLFRPGEPEAERLIYALQWVWGPRWHFASHDFEALMSLRVAQNVVYEEQNVLRFRFLDVYATDPQGRPLRDWIREFEEGWDRLLETEDAFDRLRDEIADLLRQLDEILAEAERRQEGRPPEPGERLPEGLQGRWDEITGRLRRLEGDVEEPGELQRLRRPLEEATGRLLPRLRERGVRFRVVEIEGVLGEYSFYERKVTLYPPMIELAAQDLASNLGRPPEEVYEDLYTITEMHETAHAAAHLGLDSNDRFWERPQEASPELHETVAQFYTQALIERLNDPKLREVFLKLNERQPERYTFWRYMEGIPLEQVRVWLRLQREGRWEDDILTYAREVARVVKRSQPLIDAYMPAAQRQAFYKALTDIRQRMGRAKKLTEFCEAAGALIDLCEASPLIGDIVQATVRGRLTPRWEKGLLIAATLCKDGKRVQGPTLRLSMDEIERPASLTASQLDLRDEVTHELSGLPSA